MILLSVIDQAIPYCQDVKVIYSTVSTGTDFYSIVVGMGIMLIIDFVNSWMVEKGFEWKLNLSPDQKKALFVAGIIFTALAVSLFFPIPYKENPRY